MIWLEVQGLWKKYGGKQLITRKLKEHICGWTSLNGQRTWRYSCSMWMFIKGCPQKRRILIIKWMTCFVHTSQLLSPANSVIIQWVYEKNGHGCRDGGNAQDYQHEFPFPKGDLVTPIAEYPIYQQQRPTLCPHRHHFLGSGDHPAAWWPVNYHFHHGRSSIFFFFPNGIVGLYTVAFLHAILLSKAPSVDSQNALSVTTQYFT